MAGPTSCGSSRPTNPALTNALWNAEVMEMLREVRFLYCNKNTQQYVANITPAPQIKRDYYGILLSVEGR